MRLSSLVLPLMLAGCWVPNPPDGFFECSPTGKACPDGYSCLDGTCWKNGHGPDLAAGGDDVDLGARDGGDVDMVPKKTLGERCDSADECGSGYCVDAVCCDTACDGQCQACDTQALGTCATVAGPPHGARSACAGTGSLCGGTCDGTSPSACTYPSTQTICGAACDGNCNGAGACSTGGGASCPNGFACGTNMCKTSCSNDSDCQTNFTCTAPNRVRVPESDCLDGLDNNGDGLADCADPTCNTQVSCVPAPSAGNEVGVFQTAACPTNYSSTEHMNQSLQVPSTCSGCAFSGSINCSIAFYFDYSTSTCASLTYIGTWNAGAPSCLTANGNTPLSVSEYVQTGTSSCNVSNAGSRDPVSWGTSANF